jgi:hypothetical protein
MMVEVLRVEASGAEALGRATRTLVAFEIGCLARQALRPGRRGRVGAVFARSFYASLAGTEVCVGPPGLGAGPLNLRCRSAPRDWRAAGLREGTAVLAGPHELHLPPHLAISVAEAALWTPPPPGPWSAASLGAGLLALDALLPARLPEQGLGFLALPSRAEAAARSAVAAAAREPAEALSAFLNRAMTESGDRAIPSAPDFRALIGLGPGLTPSGDDLLGGALVALHLLDRPDLAEALWHGIGGALETGTNAISRAHLAAAARGLGGAALHAILNDLVIGKTDLLPARLTAIDRIGHCSGWDALAGAVLALRAASVYRL